MQRTGHADRVISFRMQAECGMLLWSLLLLQLLLQLLLLLSLWRSILAHAVTFHRWWWFVWLLVG